MMGLMSPRGDLHAADAYEGRKDCVMIHFTANSSDCREFGRFLSSQNETRMDYSSMMSIATSDVSSTSTSGSHSNASSKDAFSWRDS